MSVTRGLTLCGVLILSTSGAACGAGGAAEAIRTEAPTYKQATGAGECRTVQGIADPLVVDWRPEQRGDLEVAMRDGIAIVKYSCKEVRLLDACSLKGTYGFKGITTKEELIRLKNGDEVRASLPTTGDAIAVKLDADLNRGMSLDVALIMIGKWSATRTLASLDELTGDCEGATHFVRTATVGAFAMSTGSSAKMRTVAEAFGAGAGAGSDADKQVSNRDGTLTDCQSATPSSAAPPTQCGAPLRVQLRAITSGRPASATSMPLEAPPHSASSSSPDGDVMGNTCPSGMVLAEGKCTSPKEARAYRCDGTPADCAKQCDKGDAASCQSLGEMQRDGRGMPADPAKAAPLFSKACEGGVMSGCSRYGVLLLYGKGVPKAPESALPLFVKACDAGDALGCSSLGAMHSLGLGVPRDPSKALTLFAQACNAGSAVGCGNLGVMYEQGEVAQKDPTKAASLYQRSCDGGDQGGCSNLGAAYLNGLGVAKDQARGVALIQRACQSGNAGACASIGFMLMTGTGVQQDLPKAFELLSSACRDESPAGCNSLGIMYSEGKGAPRDPAQASSLFDKACKSGHAGGCVNQGLLVANEGDKARGTKLLELGCKGGDALGCKSLKELGLKP